MELSDGILGDKKEEKIEGQDLANQEAPKSEGTQGVGSATVFAPGPHLPNQLENIQAEGLEEEVEMVPAERELTANEKAVQEIKAIRVGIDASGVKVSSHLGSKSECSKSLFMAKAWLGKVLAQLGAVNPYPKADTPKNIPPTQDVADVNLYAFNLKNELDKINSLRDDIGLSTDEVESLNFEGLEVEDGRLLAIAKTNAYSALCEARFELGNELSIIRNR